MLSSRLPANLTPNAVTLALAAFRSRGIAVLDLTESNPTRVGIDYPRDILDALADLKALTYDPHPLGLSSARDAVAADYARRGLIVDPSRIALTASTSEAYGLLFKLVGDPGDEVLVPRPSYPLFEHLAGLEAVVAVPYALERHGSWRIDCATLRDALTPRTRAVLVVSPNNPTGSWLHHDDLAEVSAVCADRGIVLIGDEVFADYPLDEAPHKVSVLEQTEALTCALGGLSKSAGLPQVKLGWMAIGGPADDVESMLRAYEVVADTYLSVSTPVQVAAPALLAHGATVRAAIAVRVSRNLQALRTKATEHPAVTVLPVEGGWSAVIQVPAFRKEEALVLDLLEHDHVLVHPGYFFDFSHETFVIVSLIVEPTAFDVGIDRVLLRATSPEVAA